MHEEDCEKETVEGATCTCDVLRSIDRGDWPDEADEAAQAEAMEDYAGPELDG